MLAFSRLMPRARLALMTDGLGPRARAIRDGLVLAAVCFCAYLYVFWAVTEQTVGYDAFAYWSVDLDHLYEGAISEPGWFGYSPALAQVASVFHLLPWHTFLWLWLALLVGTVIWLGGRRTLWLLAFPAVAFELHYANINLLIAAAIVLGFRYPAAWAFVVLAKVTPGVGLLWFLVRREWRKLGVAVGTTLALAALSFAVAPHLWAQWVEALTVSSTAVPPAILAVPVVVRMPLAIAVVVWGARSDRPWTVPVAATIAMPAFWYATVPSILAAVLPLAGARPRWRPEARANLEGQRVGVNWLATGDD
ncbi:MAG: DUF2029 domain-containing protein [Chloroflexota bacterium]|nr:DUF2029 domain-containing protein [Chloroflexota bacterium]